MIGARHGSTALQRRHQRGVSALEFAIISPLLFGMILAVIEAGLYHFTRSAVITATEDAARLVRTGQTKSDDATRQDFLDDICNPLASFGDCRSKIVVDITRFSTFTDLRNDTSAPVCADATADEITGTAFNTGGERDIIRVRICYLFDTFNPLLGVEYDQTDDGRRRIVATSIFRNEPFGGDDS